MMTETVPTRVNGSNLDTEKKWNQPKPLETDQQVDQHPNIYRKRTRSGHRFEINDSKGAEHVTIQHRSGSKFQFRPDGAIEMTSHNGAYNIIFGENRMKITGAYDVTVDGASSLKVKKNYNMTVSGDMNFTVEKNFNVTAQNMNQTIRENSHTIAKNIVTKANENHHQEAQSHTITGEKGVTVASTDSSVNINAGGGIGIKATQNIGINAGAKMSIDGGSEAIVSAPSTSVTGSSALKLNGASTSVSGSQGLDLSGGQSLKMSAKVVMASGALLGTWSGAGAPANPQGGSPPVKAETIPVQATVVTADQGNYSVPT